MNLDNLSKENLEDIIIALGKKLELTDNTIRMIALYSQKDTLTMVRMARWLKNTMEMGKWKTDKEAIDKLGSLLG